MVFYRKYRPQKIDELDKEDVRNRLKSIFKVGEIPHAFLFSGPKGTGKTSTARIVAKIVNCEIRENEEFEPCGKCDNCKSIRDGTNIDVFEIDAASNRGIDEIRALREGINLAPATGKFKVYIIDEVHMLTREAFNALLKTLEEPPSHTVFILATTEFEKLPETIVSRCVVLQFSKATESEIIRSLERVAGMEKIEAGKKVLSLIAKVSDGSFRDAVKILEEGNLLGKLDEEKIREVIGQKISVLDFMEILLKKETKEALGYIEKAADTGFDLKRFLEAVLNFLHDLLLAKYEVSTKSEEISRKLPFSEKDLKKLIELFSKSYKEAKLGFLEELPLEMAVIEWCGN